MKNLQAAGVTFDAPFHEVPNIGLKIIVDPVGTRIELTEGLTVSDGWTGDTSVLA